MRQRLKLHTGEDDLRNYMKLMSSQHTSSEDEATGSQTGGQQPARNDPPDMQEVLSPKVPKLIELKSKRVNITAALD